MCLCICIYIYIVCVYVSVPTPLPPHHHHHPPHSHPNPTPTTATQQVRLSAGESLVQVTRLLRPDDRGKHALTLVLQLAHDDEQEELRMTAVRAEA